MSGAKRRIFPLFVLSAVVVSLLSAGYWLYQRSVREVIHATTVSFMEQIAEHDRQNMLNQMDSKWSALMTITNRINAAREYSLAEVFTD